MMRCITIDDEPLALQQIESYVRKTPFLESAGSYRSALDAMKALSEQPADLLLVDINMPDLNGLDFVRSLSVKPLTIFTTAYSEYAIDGFRVDAIDYLLKPIGYPDFLRSMEKAYRQFKLLNSKEPAREDSRFLFVKSDYKVVQIDIDKITYIESRSEYVRIYTSDMHPVMSLGSLKSYEEHLPSDQFMRIHRSFIVNLHKIKAVDRKHIIADEDIRIPIGEIYEEKFRAFLSERSV